MGYPFFFKYQQAGNDFIVFDDRSLSFPINNQAFISQICHRRFGVGADGVILLQTSIEHDFRMRIFNSDGKEAESCGNGICCLAKFIKDQRLTESKEIVFELLESTVKIFYKKDDILIQMSDPTSLKLNDSISLGDQIFKCHYINTGVPHFVTFVEDVKKIELKKVGALIRNHLSFAPHGTNVNFAAVKGPHEVAVRTYERGVENETLACGTGACAVALIASLVYNLSSPIKVSYRGGVLMVYFQKNQTNLKSVSLVGAPKKIYNGLLSINCNDGDTLC